MALFDTYTKPGVYVTEHIADAGIPLFGSTRIPVFIGEGEEYKTFSGVELHRGSSNYADEAIVNENITDQVTGSTRNFQTNYWPVVTGDGKATVTNKPSDIKVYANGVPLLVSSLNGATGQFVTSDLIPMGTDLKVSYFFAWTDTQKTDNLSSQVPTFANALAGITTPHGLSITPTVPGALGNNVTVVFAPMQFSAQSQGLQWLGSGAMPAGFTVNIVEGGSSSGGTASFATNVMTLVTAPTTGSIEVGQSVTSAGVTPGTTILALASGTLNAVGSTYTLSSAPGTITTQGFTTAPVLGVAFATPNLTYTVTPSTTLAQVLALTIPTGANTVASALPGTVTSNIITADSKAASYLTYADNQAVTGIGTDTITVQVMSSTTGLPRTNAQLASLLSSGMVYTLSAGALQVTVTQNASNAAANLLVSAPFVLTGGGGPSTNKTFKVTNVPIVDGTNGGVVTTSPNAVQVTVNGVPAVVSTVDGAAGLFTLSAPVAPGSTLSATYYTNTYQNTYDVLPGGNITNLVNVGYGPGRSDFISGVDYVLQTLPSGDQVIQWGASFAVASNATNLGQTPFDATVITPTLVDQRVFLRPCTGVLNGKNFTFQLQDSPTDGSGLSRVTDDPSKISVYAGTDPMDAQSRQPVRVVSLSGATRTFTLFTPPPAGEQLFASYHRNTLSDHTYDLSVVVDGVTGQGSYDLSVGGAAVPVIAPGTAVVAAGAFGTTGIVWPNGFSDLAVTPGSSPVETITLSFQDDGLLNTITPALQASSLLVVPGLNFYATTFGTGPNGITGIVLDATTPTADATAITVLGETITIAVLNGTSQARTLQDVVNLFANPSYAAAHTTPLAGKVNVQAVGTPNMNAPISAGAVVHLTGGAVATTAPYSVRYLVTSSRTSAQAQADHLGITGGATTPTGANTTLGLSGYLGQTYIDPTTGVTFTIVNPNLNVLNNPEYLLTHAPSPSYYFAPGDTLTFVSAHAPRVTSAIPVIDIPGVTVKVTSTYGMGIGASAKLTTYNYSGGEPSVGDFYYVDYQTTKTAEDMALKVYTNIQDVYAAYGAPSATNKLSLGAYLYNLNGGQVLACIQVPKQLGLDTASEQTYMDAIASLTQPLPGSDNKANMILPMTTSTTVIGYLSRFLITQASERAGGPAISYVGCPITATPNDARALARSLKSDRVVAMFPGGAVLTLNTNGVGVQFGVGGEFIAAAMAGADLNPAIDVATSLTRSLIVGFDRLVKRYDDNTMDLAASDGVCWLVEKAAGLQVRHYISTNMSSPLTREPTNRKTADEIRFRLATNLDQFISRKILTSLVNDINIVVNSTMQNAMNQELVENYKDVVVSVDQFDSTVIHVSLTFKPISSLIWLDVNLTVTTKL